MSQYVDGNTKAFEAGGEIPVNRRVVFGSNGKVTLAAAHQANAGMSVTPTFVDGEDITVRLRTASGTQKMVAAGPIVAGKSVYGASLGRIAASGSVFIGTALETATAANDVIEVLLGANIDLAANSGSVQQLRARVTAAQVNAGHTLLVATPGRGYRLVDCTMIAIGGSASGATSVDLLGTQAASGVQLVANAVAGLTEDTRLPAGAANSAVLAGGASFVACDDNTAITIGKSGSDLATATDIDISISYVLA